MDETRVAVLLEQLLSEFRTFGEGQQILQNKIESLEAKTEGLVKDMDIVKPTLKGLVEDMDIIKPTLKSVSEDVDGVKPALTKINNRLDSIEDEIIKLNPESRAAFKRAK